MSEFWPIESVCGWYKGGVHAFLPPVSPHFLYNCTVVMHHVTCLPFQPFRKFGYNYGPWAPKPSWLFKLNPSAEKRRDSQTSKPNVSLHQNLQSKFKSRKSKPEAIPRK